MGTRSWLARLSCSGLLAPVLAHHRSSSSSSMGRTPRMISAPRRPEPRPAEESCCLNVQEPLAHSSSGQTQKWGVGVGGADRERLGSRKRGKDSEPRRKEDWLGWCRVSDLTG